MTPEKDNNKKLTLKEIAQKADTSKSTVSRVLTHHPSISDKTKARVMKVVEESGYRPNLFARGLAGGRTGLVGVIASSITSGFFAEVIRGLDLYATQYDGHLVSSFAHGPDDFLRLWDDFQMAGQVEGLVLVAPPLALFDVDYESELPVVLCAARPAKQREGWSALSSVVMNNSLGIELLIDHFDKLGLRKIVHIPGPTNNFDALERERAFFEAIAARPHMRGEKFGLGLSQQCGRINARNYLKERGMDLPDAFLCFNDSIALGMLEVLKDLPNKCQGVAISGWDSGPAGEILGLTSIEVPMMEIGRSAGQLLFARLRDGTSVARPGPCTTVDVMLRQRISSTGIIKMARPA